MMNPSAMMNATGWPINAAIRLAMVVKRRSIGGAFGLAFFDFLGVSAIYT
jgi:hypothetical protein